MIERGIKGFDTDCRDCGRAIWMVAREPTAGGAGWVPLEPTGPEDLGTVAINGQGRAVEVGVGHPLHSGELYRRHRETCPRSPALRPERRDLD